MTQKHTALPWFLEGNWSVNSKNVGGWLSAFPPSGMPVFELAPAVGTKEQIIANAEFIVRACNSHYEMLKALKAAKEVVNVAESMTSCRSDDEFVWNAQKLINAAIAKAEGGEA